MRPSSLDNQTTEVVQSWILNLTALVLQLDEYFEKYDILYEDGVAEGNKYSLMDRRGEFYKLF